MLSRASMLSNSKHFRTQAHSLPLEEQTKTMAALNNAEKVLHSLHVVLIKTTLKHRPHRNVHACNSRAYTHAYNKIVLVRVQQQLRLKFTIICSVKNMQASLNCTPVWYVYTNIQFTWI
jgi:hypothetical protein